MLATLSIIQTSPTCVRYRLLDAEGKVLWQNRVAPVDAGHAGARERMAAWALAHHVRIVERQPHPEGPRQLATRHR